MSKKLTPMQQKAVDALVANPDLTPNQLCDIAGVKGWDDNRASFIMRLVSSGAVKLVPTAPNE